MSAMNDNTTTVTIVDTAERTTNHAHDAEITPGLRKTFFLSAFLAGGAVGHAVAAHDGNVSSAVDVSIAD